MSKVRKPCNRKAQIDRARRALVRTNHAAVVNVAPPDIQIMANWKNCTQICNVQVAHALCDLAHRWTIYISVFCQKADGMQYSKSVQFTPPGIHLVAGLEQTMIEQHKALMDDNNPNHVIGSGWIAIPDVIEVDEAAANKLFAAMGVWQRARVA